MEDSIKALRSENEVLSEEYDILRRKMEEIERVMYANVQKIQGMCEHVLERDEPVYGERSRHTCVKCGMWR